MKCETDMECKGFNIDRDLALKTLRKIENDLNNLEDLRLEDLNYGNSAIVIIDMIKGFAKEGSLSSNRVDQLIPRITGLLSADRVQNKVFVCDSHPENATEFLSYPMHAVKNTIESQIVDELIPFIDDKAVLIHKNSTNGMASAEMKTYLSSHQNLDNFIVIGDCTDICILQFALSIKAHFNELNLPKRVIVPYLYVDTYDLEANHHHGDLMNLFALYNMKINGVEIYKDILF